MKEQYQAFLNGNNQIFSLVFEEHHDILLMIAYRYLRDTDDASDVIAEVYKKLLDFSVIQRKHHLPNDYKEFIFYVRKMVKNKCLDTIKQRANHKRLISEHFSKNGSTQNFEEQELFEPRLQEMIQQILNYRELEIISLHVQGYKNAEIAKKLDLSYFTVRNLIHESKKKLKEQYKKHFQ